VTSDRYRRHYLQRLRESVARGPAAEQVLPILDVFADLPLELQFGMVRELERVLRDVDPGAVDWVAGRELVRRALQDSRQDADDFGRRLRALAGTG
jgi:hypothetical protein